MPSRTLTSSEPLLHCCDTWHVLAAAGTLLPNRPAQPETWAAIRKMHVELLRPLEEHFGVIDITYGFAGAALIKAIRKRAADGGWHPNVCPQTDQHAGHELNTRGNRICKRDGIAVDLRVPGRTAVEVSDWVRANLPFDAIYLYDLEDPFHVSWSPKPRGTVIRMVPWKDRLVPRVEVRGCGWRGSPRHLREHGQGQAAVWCSRWRRAGARPRASARCVGEEMSPAGARPGQG